MKGTGGRLALALAMPLLVVPLAGLTWLAARSVDQQESGMRARLRESLLLEVGQTNGRIRDWFSELPAELGAGLRAGIRTGSPREGTAGRPTARELAEWKEREPLVGIPFLLDAAGSIVYPDAKIPGSPDEETRLFYWRYLNVFGNAERIPVYRNIAAEYEESIVDEDYGERPPAAKDDADTTVLPPTESDVDSSNDNGIDSPTDARDVPRAYAPSPEMAAPSAADAGNAIAAGDTISAADTVNNAVSADSTNNADNKKNLSAEAPAKERSSATAGSTARSPASAPSRDAEKSSAMRSKAAQGIFESDVDVQRRVYDRAAEEGKETLKRNVNPKIDAINTRESAAARSVYIESDRYFRDLVAQADNGLVPRIFDNSFVLIYWERRGEWVVGCELDMAAVREEIAARAGTPADAVRYLAVLDHTGTPLIPVASVDPAAWRTPLVSGEISEFLPYWETAVILADESAFEGRVRASRYAFSALVLALFLSVALGAVILWRHSANRLLEARRRTGFVTTVTHELKTPLTSIRMYSEMLAEGADLDLEKRGRYLTRIVSECGRLTRLINDVLDVSKLERGNRKLDLAPIDVAGVARDTLEGIADRLRASGFEVSLRGGERPVECLADGEAVVRVLLNLLSNAEKYSSDERAIEVSVSQSDDGRRCLVAVADRGIGVPRAHRSRIFREFHRVDSSLTSERGGTGLGLSIARSLARAMGGDVTYAPRERVDGGRGSVFTLDLPVLARKEGTS